MGWSLACSIQTILLSYCSHCSFIQILVLDWRKWIFPKMVKFDIGSLALKKLYKFSVKKILYAYFFELDCEGKSWWDQDGILSSNNSYIIYDWSWNTRGRTLFWSRKQCHATMMMVVLSIISSSPYICDGYLIRR